MTIETIDRSERCGKCNHPTKYASDTLQTCDVCGKKEFYPAGKQQYLGDFYGIKIFYEMYGKTKDVSFCSAEHMFQWIISYKKSFDFMTLPYIHGPLAKDEGTKASLYISDLKRLFKVKT